jgi:hypothetical protein
MYIEKKTFINEKIRLRPESHVFGAFYFLVGDVFVLIDPVFYTLSGVFAQPHLVNQTAQLLFSKLHPFEKVHCPGVFFISSGMASRVNVFFRTMPPCRS